MEYGTSGHIRMLISQTPKFLFTNLVTRVECLSPAHGLNASDPNRIWVLDCIAQTVRHCLSAANSFNQTFHCACIIDSFQLYNILTSRIWRFFALRTCEHVKGNSEFVCWMCHAGHRSIIAVTLHHAGNCSIIAVTLHHAGHCSIIAVTVCHAGHCSIIAVTWRHAGHCITIAVTWRHADHGDCCLFLGSFEIPEPTYCSLPEHTFDVGRGCGNRRTCYRVDPLYNWMTKGKAAIIKNCRRWTKGRKLGMCWNMWYTRNRRISKESNNTFSHLGVL